MKAVGYSFATQLEGLWEIQRGSSKTSLLDVPRSVGPCDVQLARQWLPVCNDNVLSESPTRVFRLLCEVAEQLRRTKETSIKHTITALERSVILGESA